MTTYKYSYLYIDTIDKFNSAVSELNNTTRYGLDIETYPVILEGKDYSFCSKRAKIRTIQIYNPENTVAYVFDLKKLISSGADEVTLAHKIIVDKKFFIHNALFDIRFLQELRIPFVDCVCTMTMYTTVLKSRYPDSKKYSASLKEVTRQLFHEDISKLEQTSDWSQDDLTEEQIKYAGYDAVLAYRIGRVLSKDKTVHTDNFRITTNVLNAIARIIRNGVFIDTEALDVMISDWQKKVDEAQVACDKYYPGMNIRSNVQLGEWLQKNIDTDTLAGWPRTEKGALKTDAPTLIEHENIEALKPLVEFKKYQKYLSTYGESIKEMINPVTKRLHPQYTVAFTESGRLSSMNPNVQNFPRGGEYRSLFVPQFKSTTLVCADYSQVEVRVAAILSKDKRMLEAYSNGKDLYRQTASLILHKPEDSITKQERQRAKAVVLGLQFGMGAKKLCLYAKNYGVDMTPEESEVLVRNYRQAYPELYAWQIQTTEQAALSLKAYTVGGMVRQLSENNYYTCSLNTPVQGSAAEAILFAIADLDKIFIQRGWPAKIVATVHDEILVECKTSVADVVKGLLEQSMMLGFLHVFPETYGAIHNIVEAHKGASWYEAK